MAYTPKSQYKGYLFSAEDFNGLKELLNGECNRRHGNGSVQGYAGSAYQFTTKPAAGGYIMAEHGKKLSDPLRAINPRGIEDVSRGTEVKLDAVAKKIVELQKKDPLSSDTGCAASCTGLCVSGCYSACAGCSGTCTGTCTGGCMGTCTGSCQGSCAGCTGTCSGTCQGCTGT